MNLNQNNFAEIDQIIGCGQRYGQRYFLVRFKNATENEVIDWSTAKKYSLQVMEYSGSRLVWNPIRDIIDSNTDDSLNDQQDDDARSIPGPSSQSSTSNNRPPPSRLPNDIEYEDNDN